MPSRQETLDRLARHYLEKLHKAGDDLAALRGELGQIEKALDWVCESGQLRLGLSLLRAAFRLFQTEGLGDKPCRWALTMVELARRAEDTALLRESLSLRIRALLGRAELATDAGPDLQQALLAANEAFALASGNPAEEADALADRTSVLADLARVTGEDRAVRLRQALDDSDSALLRITPDSPLWLRLQSNRAMLLPQLASLPGQDRPALLRQARETFESLLEREQDPSQRAVLLVNRANALREIAETIGEADPERPALLREALRSNAEALDLYRDRPLRYGEALSTRATLLALVSTLPGENERERLLEALAAHDQALPRLRAALPSYARAQTNSAMTLVRLAQLGGSGEERTALLRRALGRLDEALALRHATTERASTLLNRSSVLLLLAHEVETEERQRLLRQALENGAAGLEAFQKQQHATRTATAFDQVLQVRQAVLHAAGPETFDRWWSEVTGRPQPDWSAPQGAATESLAGRRTSLLLAYIRANPLERLELLHLHGDELLAPEMFDLFTQIIADVDDPAMAEGLRGNLAFLRRCQEIGVDAAWDEGVRAAPEAPVHLAPVLAELEALSEDERTTYLQERPELLAELQEHGYVRVVRSPISSIPDDPELLQRFTRFFEAARLEEARPIFEEDTDRLLEHGDALLDVAVEAGARGDEVEHKIELYRELLRKCREVGIPAAFAELSAREAARQEAHRRALEIVNCRRLLDAFRLLAGGPGPATSEEAFDFLARLGRQHAQNEAVRQRIEFYRNFLRQVQQMGLRPAFALALAIAFIQSDEEEAQETTFEEARAVLSLEEMEHAFDEIRPVNAGDPERMARIEEKALLLRRAWESGLTEARREARQAAERLSEVGALLLQIATQPAGEGAQIVRDHRDLLLTPETFASLEEVARRPLAPAGRIGSEEDIRRSFQSMIRLLRRCVEIGIEEAFDERRLLAEAAMRFLNAGLEDRIASVRSDRLLLSDEMDTLLFDLWTQVDAGSGAARNIERWRRALRRCREGEAPEEAFREAQRDEERQVLLGQILVQMLETDGLEALKALVTEHADLLLGTAEAEQAIQEMGPALATTLPEAEAAQVRDLSARYSRLLRLSRTRGIDAAFAAAEEEVRREYEDLERLAGDLERLAEVLEALSAGARARFFAANPLLARRLRGLLPPESHAERHAAIQEQLQSFWSLTTLEAKRLRLEERPGLLLSEETDEVMAELIGLQEDPQIRSFLEVHRTLLRRCREIGVAGAFDELRRGAGG